MEDLPLVVRRRLGDWYRSHYWRSPACGWAAELRAAEPAVLRAASAAVYTAARQDYDLPDGARRRLLSVAGRLAAAGAANEQRLSGVRRRDLRRIRRRVR